MKFKYNIPVKIEEINELLETNKYHIIWQQKVRSKWVIVNLFNELLVAGILIYFLRDIVNVLISIGLTLPAILLVYQSRTMKYTILPDEIVFEWGLFGFKKKVVIPFEDINSITLVEYNDSNHSTIFFGTNKTYKTKKINFDMNESRPHTTFENVKNGKKVTELLNTVWQRSKFGLG